MNGSWRMSMWFAGRGVIVYGPACTGSKAFRMWKCRRLRLSLSISQPVQRLNSAKDSSAQ